MKKLLMMLIMLVVILFPTFALAANIDLQPDESIKPYWIYYQYTNSSQEKTYKYVMYFDQIPTSDTVRFFVKAYEHKMSIIVKNPQTGESASANCISYKYDSVTDAWTTDTRISLSTLTVGTDTATNYIDWSVVANFDCYDLETNELIPGFKSNFFRFTNLEDTTYNTFPKYPYSLRYQMHGYDDNSDTHFTFYMDYKENNEWHQYFMSEPVILTNTDSIEGLPVDDYIIEDQFFLFRSGELRIRVVVNGGRYANKEVCVVTPTYDTGNTPICIIQGINEGQVYSEPPSFSITKKNIDYPVELWSNGKKIETLPSTDIMQQRYFRQVDIKIGTNTIQLKKEDGTVIDETYFHMEEGFGKNPNEILDDAQEEENKLIDKNGKPIKPDSMNPIDWIIYIFNLIGYYCMQVSAVFSTAFTTAINIINQVLHLLSPVFGILPREWVVVITVSLSLGMILMILRR